MFAACVLSHSLSFPLFTSLSFYCVCVHCSWLPAQRRQWQHKEVRKEAKHLLTSVQVCVSVLMCVCICALSNGTSAWRLAAFRRQLWGPSSSPPLQLLPHTLAHSHTHEEEEAKEEQEEAEAAEAVETATAASGNWQNSACSICDWKEFQEWVLNMEHTKCKRKGRRRHTRNI